MTEMIPAAGPGPLPPRFDGGFTLSEARHRGYLRSVGGGHPVHSSRKLALLAGFADMPAAGIHVLGSALAAFTSRFACDPIQLLDVSSRFLRPVYPGAKLTLSMTLDRESQTRTARHATGVYAGHCALADGAKVLELALTIRVLLEIAGTAGAGGKGAGPQ